MFFLRLSGFQETLVRLTPLKSQAVTKALSELETARAIFNKTLEGLGRLQDVESREGQAARKLADAELALTVARAEAGQIVADAKTAAGVIAQQAATDVLNRTVIMESREADLYQRVKAQENLVVELVEREAKAKTLEADAQRTMDSARALAAEATMKIEKLRAAGVL